MGRRVAWVGLACGLRWCWAWAAVILGGPGGEWRRLAGVASAGGGWAGERGRRLAAVLALGGGWRCGFMRALSCLLVG